MSNSSRYFNPHLRASKNSYPASGGKSSALSARIDEKKAELDNLRQLRDLSAGLASQMQILEEKLATLSDGTEAIAAVLSNWHNVLQAINMASQTLPKINQCEDQISQPSNTETSLPQTLVRIPTDNTLMTR